METYNLSRHVKEDRIDRVVDILMTIGMGEPVANVINATDHTNKILTSTGVVMIMSTISNKLITTYVATVKQSFAIWRTCHGKVNFPGYLLNRITKNNK